MPWYASFSAGVLGIELAHLHAQDLGQEGELVRPGSGFSRLPLDDRRAADAHHLGQLTGAVALGFPQGFDGHGHRDHLALLKSRWFYGTVTLSYHTPEG